MTNEEKYKTPEERENAFRKFCYSYVDDIGKGCRECPAKTNDPIKHCQFNWLALEVEDEKPLPCPCCGGRASVTVGTNWAQVKCQVCRLETELESSRGEAIAKWNRRAK